MKIMPHTGICFKNVSKPVLLVSKATFLGGPNFSMNVAQDQQLTFVLLSDGMTLNQVRLARFTSQKYLLFAPSWPDF